MLFVLLVFLKLQHVSYKVSLPGSCGNIQYTVDSTLSKNIPVSVLKPCFMSVKAKMNGHRHISIYAHAYVLFHFFFLSTCAVN